MAELIAAVAGFAAITQLGGDFYRLSKRLKKYARHITHARAEIKAADLEVARFTDILTMFDENINDPSAMNSSFIQAATKTKLPSILSQQSKLVLLDFHRVLNSIRPLRNDVTASRFTKIWARLTWARRIHELEPLKTSLTSIQVSMTLFCSMLNVIVMKHKIQVREQEGSEVLELRKKLRQCERKLRIWQNCCREIERDSDSRKPQPSAAGTPLSELLRTVQDLVEREKGQQRKERRERGSNPSTSPHTSPTASALSSHSNAAMFPPPLALRAKRVTPVPSESGGDPSLAVLPSTDEEQCPLAVKALRRGWVPTVRFASEPGPQDDVVVVVDDGINPLRVEHRVSKAAPSVGSDRE